MGQRSVPLSTLLTLLGLGLGLVGLSGCGDATPRVDPGQLAITSPAGSGILPEDLGAEKTTVNLSVPPDQLLVVTTLVFRNRNLDRTLSSECLLFDQGPQATQHTLGALIFLPHGPLRPSSDTWLLRLPSGPAVEVHDSPDLSLHLLGAGAPTAPSSVGGTNPNTAVLLAIDPDGAFSLPPTYAQLQTAHIAALIFVRLEHPQATDPRLATLFRAGVLIPHGHLAAQLALALADQHYLDEVKPLCAPPLAPRH